MSHPRKCDVSLLLLCPPRIHRQRSTRLSHGARHGESESNLIVSSVQTCSTNSILENASFIFEGIDSTEVNILIQLVTR